jgi:DnaJ like chaperone protein
MEFQFQVASADASPDGRLDPNKEKLLRYICSKFNFSQNDFNSFYNFGTASNFFRGGSTFYTNFSGMGGGHARQQQGHWQGHGYGQGHGRNYGYSQAASVDKVALAYKTLGVAANATQKEIKAAYRKLISRHHPDKLAAKGLPPEMMQFAKEKTQEITVAYDVICKQRGFS